MREFKFRIWAEDKGVMYSYNPHSPTYKSLLFRTKSNFVTMQYTGLKDRNGLEIYEGDIVKDLTEYEDLYETPGLYENNKVVIPLKVHYTEHEARFEILGDFHPTEMYFKYSDQLHDRTLEIIGNMYENPELLS